MRSLPFRWLTLRVNRKTYSLMALGVYIATVASSRAYSAETDAYSGLAHEYAISQSADFVTVTNPSRGACTLLCRQSMKPHGATFPEVQRLLPKPVSPGTWLLLLKGEGAGQPTLVRLTAEDQSKSLASYFCDIKRYVDANKSIPLSTYYHHLWTTHWLVEQDVCAGFARATHRVLSQFAASLPLTEIAPHLEDARRPSPCQARIGIVMLAYSHGSERDKVEILERLIQEPLKGEWPGQAQNLDAILSALLICDPKVGTSRIESILASRSYPLEIRQKTLRAISFGLAQQKLSQTEIFEHIRLRLNDFDDVYPEVLTLAHVCGVQLDSSEVAKMVVHPKIVTGSPEESVSHRAVVEYYWTQDNTWRTDFLRQVTEQDRERSARLGRRLHLRKTPGRMSNAALEDAIHRPDDGDSCYLGSVISK